VDSWRKLMLHVTTHISDSQNIFVTDGSIGSHGSETNIRIISTDPNASLFLRNLLHPVSSDFEKFNHDIVVYHAPAFIPQKSDLGVKSEAPFVTFMTMKGAAVLDNLASHQQEAIPGSERTEFSERIAGVLIVAGTNSLSTLQSALLDISSFFHLRKMSLPLRASILGSSSGKPILVFDPKDYLVTNRVHSSLLSQDCIWNANGLSSSFVGITHSDASRISPTGALAWQVGDKTHITQKQSSWHSSQHPSSLVFLVDKSGSPPVGTVDVATAGELFASSTKFGIQPDEDTALTGFKALVNETKPSIYVINTHGTTQQKVDSLLEQIANGTLVL